jgi:hypothetical protein
MLESYNINSILEAIEDLNKKTKKVKDLNKIEVLKNDDISPQVDKIIREAEEYKKKNLSKLDTKTSSLDQGVSNDQLFSNVEQDKTILLNEKTELEKKIDEMKVSFNKEITELKTKLEYQSIIYKEDYEKLIIENNDIKQRLKNAKQQINSFKESKLELEAAISNLNNVLSKSSIVANITPIDFSSKNDIEVLDSEKNKEIKD